MTDSEKITHAFGVLLEDIGRRMPTHYPLVKFPKSLLPADKEIVRLAMEEVIQKSDNPEIKSQLQTSLHALENFIDDEEAYNTNHQMLQNKGYWDALRRKGTI